MPEKECLVCHRPLCRRETVLSRVAGLTRDAMCVDCLAAHLDASREDMLRSFTSYIRARSCFWTQWRYGCPCYRQGSRACCPSALGR